MDRIVEHLENVSLSLILTGVCASALFFFLVPRIRRLEVSLAIMALVLTISRLPDFGPIANAAKLCSGVVYFMVAVAAIGHPGGRRYIPICYWGYVLLGILAIVYIRGTVDFLFSLALRLQWLMLAIAAILTSRTIVNEESLTRILRGLFIGLSMGCLITLSSLLDDPGAAFRNGFGRFMPYACNPNQIGITFALTASLGFLFSQTAKTPTARTICLIIATIAFGQNILTVSRGSLMVLGITTLPTLLTMIRRPIFAVISVAIIAVIFNSMIHVAESATFDRLNRGISSRNENTLEVLAEVRERPWYGLGFTQDLYAYETEMNAHNAYVSMLYLGGLTLALPLFSLQMYGHWQMLKVWLARRRLPFNPMLLSFLLSLSLALFAQGFINDMEYYPTYTWAFINVLVACISVMLGRIAKRKRIIISKNAPMRLKPAF